MILPDRTYRDDRSRLLGILGALSLTGYLFWNAYWLVQGRVPPALFLSFTGLPAPTTGGTRALTALIAGDFNGMLRHNALVLPLTLLFVTSLIHPWLSRPPRLTSRLARAWVVLLAAAWVLKLTQFGMR